MTDNEAWATSAEWDNAMDNLKVNQRKCGAYEHHQNGVVERRFRALNAMCGLYLDSTSNLDIKFWDYAYLHANENLQYYHQQGQKRSPMEKWQDAFPTERVHTDTEFLRAWGSKCYMYNETRSGFEPKKTVGYLLGYAPQHSRDMWATVGLACAKSNSPPNSPKQLQLACPGLFWTWMWAGALKNEFLAPPPFPVGSLSTAPVGLATRNCFSRLGFYRKNLRRREVALPRARPFLRARLFL